MAVDAGVGVVAGAVEDWPDKQATTNDNSTAPIRGAAGGEFASRVIGFSCLLLEYGTFDDTSFAIHQMPLDRAAAPGYIGARIRATREGPDLKGARG